MALEVLLPAQVMKAVKQLSQPVQTKPAGPLPPGPLLFRWMARQSAALRAPGQPRLKAAAQTG